MADEILTIADDSAIPQPEWLTRYSDVENSTTPGFTDVIGTAFQRENLLVRSIANIMEEPDPTSVDLNYSWYDHKQELTRDIPERFHMELAGAISLEDAERRKESILKDLSAEDELVKAGWSGISAQFVAGLLSPENLIPLGSIYGWANKGGRLATAVKTGLVTGATAGGTEAALAATDYSKDAEDVIYAGIFGFGLGGALGAAFGKSADSVAAPRQADEVPVPSAVKAEEVTPQVKETVFGPPKPEIITTRHKELIKRAEGPIDVNAHVAVNALYDRIKALDLGTISNKVKQSIAEDFVKIDHAASLDSETAAKLDEIYDLVGYTPVREVEVTERVAGSWKSIQEDIAYAQREFKKDLDTRLAEEKLITPSDADLVNYDRTDDSLSAARSPDADEQIVDQSSTENDIIVDSNQWAREQDIQRRLDADRTNKAAVLSKVLASDFTRLINSKSNVVKKLAHDLLEGGTGTLGRQKTAAMYKDMYERRILSKGIIPLNEQYVVWAKENGLNFYQRNFHTTGYDTFYTQVREVLENRTFPGAANFEANYSRAVIEAADRWDDMMAEALSIGQKSGWEAVQGIPTRKGYVPLVWKGTAILRHTKAKSIAVIAKGYRSVGVDAEVADKIAQAVVKRALDGTAGVDTNLAGLLSKDRRGQLQGMLEGMGLSDSEVKGLIKRLDDAETKAGPGFTKGRTAIDLNTQEGGVKLLDLVDNDLNAIASRYARDVAGRSALAKKGITNESIWKSWKQAALKDSNRVTGLTAGDDKLSEHLDDIKSYFTSTPIAGGVNVNVRRLQQLATVSSLGMVGAAQLAELGTIVGRLGLKVAAKSMPSVKEIVTLAKKVRKGGDPGADAVIDELRPLLGDFDYDHLLYRPDIQIDDKLVAGYDFTTFGKVADKLLGKANTALGYASGMNTVRHFEHRLAAKMMINKFAQLATDPAAIEKSAARMEDIGLSPADLRSVVSQINRHATFDADGTLTAMNLTRWPEEVAENFAMAINRHTAQVVQRQLAGETSAWMHKTVGSMLTQFRHFPIVAFEKQLLRNLRFHDQAFYSTLMYGFAVSYGVQSIKAALSADERSQEDLMKQTVNYMGMASILPEIATLANQLGLAPDVLNTRKLGHTGARADEFDIVDFVPVAGQLNKMAKLIGLPGKALIGDEVSQTELRAAMMALPFSTTLFGKALMQIMLEE